MEKGTIWRTIGTTTTHAAREHKTHGPNTGLRERKENKETENENKSNAVKRYGSVSAFSFLETKLIRNSFSNDLFNTNSAQLKRILSQFVHFLIHPGIVEQDS